MVLKLKYKIKIGNFKMKVMGIDPAFAKKNAYAVFENDRVVEYGFIKDYEHYQTILLEINPGLVGIEEPYFNRKDDNPGTFQKLVKVAAILEYITQSLSFSVLMVKPVFWLSAINYRNQPMRRCKERDQWIISVAKGLICSDGFYKLSIDEVCAINIAAWAARRD